MLVGYARVSTDDQDTRMQRDALERHGVRRIYEEKASGVSTRPQLRRLLDDMKPGDVLVVWKIDRLARGLFDLLETVERLKSKGCGFRSLTEPMDTTSPIGVFLLQVLGAVAQLERSMIRERVITGQIAALERGVRFGRPETFDASERERVVKAWQSGATIADVARQFGVKRDVVRRVVKMAESPSDPRYGPRRKVLGPLLAAKVGK